MEGTNAKLLLRDDGLRETSFQAKVMAVLIGSAMYHLEGIARGGGSKANRPGTFDRRKRDRYRMTRSRTTREHEREEQEAQRRILVENDNGIEGDAQKTKTKTSVRRASLDRWA